MDKNTQDLLVGAFSAALDIDKSTVNDDLQYQGIPQWDSITHMFLIGEIESTFNIEIDPDDVLEINSFSKAKELLIKYNISPS